MGRIKKVALVTLVLLLAAALIAGCGQSKSGSGKQETAAGSNEINIGVNYELSGDVATYGTNTKNAILLAFEEINSKGGVLGGKKINPIVLDNGSKKEESMSVAAKLVTENKVVALLGPATTGNTLAAVPVATDNKVPLLTTSATNPDVTVDPQTKKVRDYIFRICFTDPPQAIVGAEFAAKDLGAKKAAILYDNTNDYSKGLYQVFKEEFTKRGGQVVAEESFNQGDQDFRPALTRFKSAGADLIYVPAYYEQVGKIISQARELGITVPMLGADGWDSPKLAEFAGGAANLKETYFTNHYSASDPNPKVQAFVKAYKEKYGSEPDAFAALGYDAAYLLADAINRAGKADPEAIRQALADTKNFEGVTGKLSFDANHNPVKEIAIIALVDGKQTLKAKIKPQE
ncbi:Leu/Ile/Val-binding protein [Moorella glycerini]|uniref:Leucine-, isoleucine-, valine-, threonine-, and alanine-binding protein n=1 Tax=Neomoorella stamsii TaxID=1266720 RepID=A0A9X7J4C9_9FIRM|nr:MULTISPECIES: ABC transporter substrate-binding protein [Moorella]PRR73075.1 Leucine-, isoleucine-, valine-, threonine-, and alanine-binding protein precursor [Moorella stamsii]CEP67713.1 Leu/Ile/Val-binding protein [Moorella glycerini]